MRIFKRTAAALVSGMLLTGGIYGPATASFGGLTLVPLTPEVAAKLPPGIKPSDVTGMSLQTAPLKSANPATQMAVMDSKEQAQLLIRDVGRHLRHAKRSSFYSSQAEAEYGAGVRAFGNGRYAQAIDHLRAADKCVTGIPNERVEVG